MKKLSLEALKADVNQKKLSTHEKGDITLESIKGGDLADCHLLRDMYNAAYDHLFNGRLIIF
ncbi:hypothetical protein [Siphonobacter sp. SORGH_AS_1065]|uniref:hypothetical protein n=1 Tax=Siphonobacter sp. SORGH_AS_1065 TaxID=3041795 RepID=UPI00277F36CA|nr:hypothetical protein [Siphonobacter sp. SORGH_AS_1065]MDQ1087447.1 hypothetical protein [Siphonobacter sp. SORGH_AS_1065]